MTSVQAVGTTLPSKRSARGLRGGILRPTIPASARAASNDADLKLPGPVADQEPKLCARSPSPSAGCGSAVRPGPVRVNGDPDPLLVFARLTGDGTLGSAKDAELRSCGPITVLQRQDPAEAGLGGPDGARRPGPAAPGYCGMSSASDAGRRRCASCSGCPLAVDLFLPRARPQLTPSSCIRIEQIARENTAALSAYRGLGTIRSSITPSGAHTKPVVVMNDPDICVGLGSTPRSERLLSRLLIQPGRFSR